MSSSVYDQKTKILATDPHRQDTDNKDFLSGRPAQIKVLCLSGKSIDNIQLQRDWGFCLRRSASNEVERVEEAKFLRPSVSVERAKGAGGYFKK